jgi:hypothetical protein
MRERLTLARSTTEIAKDIKSTMDSRLTSLNLTVIQVLSDRERAKVFNVLAAAAYPDKLAEFHDAIGDFVKLREGKVSPRRTRKVAGNAWKWDIAADRRAREGSTAPNRSRPEVYNPDVIRAFADTIAKAANRTHLAVGHHGETTLSDTAGKGGPMFRVLVAAVRWAMVAAWQSWWFCRSTHLTSH